MHRYYFCLRHGRGEYMKQILILTFLFVTALAALSIDEWQYLRFSEKTPQNNIYLRTQINQDSFTTNEVLYDNGAEVEAVSLNDLGFDTYQCLVPATQSRSYYGLRKRVGNYPLDVVPVYYSGTGLPALGHMTPVATDEINNDLAANYDIVADYVSFSDTKLYTAIQNRGGGFPTSGGFLVYNSYMNVIADPNVDPDDPNAVVWALHYVNAAGLVNSGLYRITGTSVSDLQRIGDISTTIDAATNSLIMSCDWADLLAEDEFLSWCDADNPYFGLISLTARISFSGAVDQDNSLGGITHPIPLFADPVSGYSGQISNYGLQIEDDDVYFQANYHNPNALFVFGLEYQTESGDSYPLSTIDIDPSQTMYYRSVNLLGSLAEYDNEAGWIQVERYPQAHANSPEQSFSYILEVSPVENLSIAQEEDNLIVSWDPVIETGLGNPLTIDRYRLEVSSTIDFAEYELLGISQAPQWQIGSADLAAWNFFRVIAIKDIP